eukprot:2364274-Prymnesium_polylepis.1
MSDDEDEIASQLDAGDSDNATTPGAQMSDREEEDELVGEAPSPQSSKAAEEDEEEMDYADEEDEDAQEEEMDGGEEDANEEEEDEAVPKEESDERRGHVFVNRVPYYVPLSDGSTCGRVRDHNQVVTVEDGN